MPEMNAVIEFASYWVGDPPKVIFEAGACDCSDTLRLHRTYPQAEIWTFECNPETLPHCRTAVMGTPKIHLVEKAAYNRQGLVKFHQIDTARSITNHKNGNPGASSLFVASGAYPGETYVQKEIEVEATTFARVIEENNLPDLDMLWMDLQGGELAALEGLGDYIAGVKQIMTEVEFQEIYIGQPLFEDIDGFLQSAGFYLAGWPHRNHWFGNAVYRRNETQSSISGEQEIDHGSICHWTP